MIVQNRELGANVRCITLSDSRFKSTQLTVALRMPLCAQTAEEQALLPRLLTRACERYPDFTALQRRLNRLYGATVEGSVARVGEAQVLVLTAECTADRYALNGESIAAQCAQLLCEMLFCPALENGVFRTDDVETERRCLAEEIRAQINEKQWYARCRAEQLLCAGEAYGIGRYGTVERVEAVTPEQVAEAWKRVLKQASVQLIIQSETPLPSVEQAFAEGFAAVEDRAPTTVTTAIVRKAQAPVYRTERMNVNQCKLVMGFRCGVAEPDSQTAAMRVMCALLGGTATSLLMRNVREKLSLCYYCSSQYDRLKGILFVQSGVEESNLQRAEDEIQKQIASIADGAFTEKELNETKHCMQQSFESVGDSLAAVSAWYVSQGGTAQMKTPQQTYEEIAAVTREQVAAAAKQLTLGCVYVLAPEEGGTTDELDSDTQ